MVSDSQAKLKILGSETPLIVGQAHNVSCLVESYNEENFTLEWTLDGEFLMEIVHNVAQGYSSTSLQWMLNYNFTRGDENKQLVCTVHISQENPPGRCSYSTSGTVDLYCECFQ